jgi:hypothetical protein
MFVLSLGKLNTEVSLNTVLFDGKACIVTTIKGLCTLAMFLRAKMLAAVTRNRHYCTCLGRLK